MTRRAKVERAGARVAVIERRESLETAGLAYRLAQRSFLCRLIVAHRFGRDAGRQVRVDQAVVTRLEAGVVSQGVECCSLIAQVPRFVGRVVAGCERGEPEIKIAVERFIGEGRDFRRQAQGFEVQPGLCRPFAAAGDALHQTAPRAVRLGRRRRDLESGVAAEGAEEDAVGFLDFLERDGGFGIAAARRLGRPVVPEFSDEFFHDVSVGRVQ